MDTPEQAEAASDRQYEAYRSLYASLRRRHPQRVELNRAEFESALNDNRTLCIPMTVDGLEIQVPELVPVETNEWLNADFYARRFPETYGENRLLHLTTWPDTDLGVASHERLTELAHDGATIVLDGPSDGDWSVRTALDHLVESLPQGIVRSQELLGTQTYWCGVPKNSRMTPSETPSSLSDAARATARDSVLGGDETGAYLRHELTDSEVQKLFGLYESAYSVLADHPCAQGVTPSKFRQMMIDDPAMTKIVYQRKGVVESICLITTDLRSLDWINIEHYEQRFGASLYRRGVHWYPAIATRPDKTGARNARALMELLGDLYETARNQAAIVFDTPDLNSAFLPAYLEELINGLPHYEVKFEVIAEHEYYALELRA